MFADGGPSNTQLANLGVLGDVIRNERLSSGLPATQYADLELQYATIYARAAETEGAVTATQPAGAELGEERVTRMRLIGDGLARFRNRAVLEDRYLVPADAAVADMFAQAARAQEAAITETPSPEGVTNAREIRDALCGLSTPKRAHARRPRRGQSKRRSARSGHAPSGRQLSSSACMSFRRG